MSENKKGMKTQNQTIPAKNEYKVFVVEDSDAYRTLLVEFISKIKSSSNGDKAKYVIHSFSSGEECLDNIYLKPDVVVLDYHLDSGGYLKNMDGLALLKKLKRLSPLTEVVVLSCQTSVEVVKEMLKAGAGYYIKKDNFSQIKVSQLIENFIRKKEKVKHKNAVIALWMAAIILLMAVFFSIYFFKN